MVRINILRIDDHRIRTCRSNEIDNNVSTNTITCMQVHHKQYSLRLFPDHTERTVKSFHVYTLFMKVIWRFCGRLSRQFRCFYPTSATTTWTRRASTGTKSIWMAHRHSRCFS